MPHGHAHDKEYLTSFPVDCGSVVYLSMVVINYDHEY